MKIKEYLAEAVATIISAKDYPEWVKKVLSEEGKSFASMSVVADDNPTIGGSLHDADVIKVYFWVNGKVVKQNSASYDSLLVSDDKEKAIYQGIKVKLFDDDVYGKPKMILETHTYPKRAILYAHPNQMPKTIGGEISLTDDEKKVLLITKSYISSYRTEYFKRYGVFKNLEEIKKGLVNKGLMTAAGAINIAGKNAISNIGSLEKLFGYK